ncbi:hypothetical protein LCGC14_1589540 [marine sediment metagenome]|uniref:Uncharacterized protein n=1 Tax=marine sediment metagenome TaxID=412755 RepID=A0A0F9KV23_9ZZZZ
MVYIALFLALLLVLFFVLLGAGKLDFISRWVKKELALAFFLNEDEGEDNKIEGYFSEN